MRSAGTPHHHPHLPTDAAQRRLAALWPKVRSRLPVPPATIVELGCGRLGGFVPRLLDSGYEALGVDPVAPEGRSYRQVNFERCELPAPLDGVVACTSLHHVAEPAEVLDKIGNALGSGGLVIVVEWDWESFDEATALWCFGRLGPPETESWLHHHRDGWRASRETWRDYLHGWASREGLHSGQHLILELDQRFERLHCARGPYFFPDLVDTAEEDEIEAIRAGQIQATRIDYVGRLCGAS